MHRNRAGALRALIVAGVLASCSAIAAQATVAPGRGHPSGVVAATLWLDLRPFGQDVSAAGTAYTTQVDGDSLARLDLATAALREPFSASVEVGDVPTDVAFTHAGTTAYVANQSSDDVGEVDVATNTQTATIPVTGDPIRVIVTPDDKTVYVATNNELLIAIDRATRTVAATLSLPPSCIANGLAFSADGHRLFASCLLAGQVLEIDVATHSVLRAFPVPDAVRLQGVAVAEDGSQLYVADERTGSLYVVDLARGDVVTTVNVGPDAFDVQLTRDQTQIYVGLLFSGKVQVVDRATLVIVNTIVTGGTPRRIAFDAPGTTALIANETGWVDVVR